jgi:hypothetical protein
MCGLEHGYGRAKVSGVPTPAERFAEMQQAARRLLSEMERQRANAARAPSGPKSVTLESVSSSRVKQMGYDPENEQLFVRFVKPEGQGTPWVYENVPESVFEQFQRSSSKGKFVNEVLNRYPYHKGNF